MFNTLPKCDFNTNLQIGLLFLLFIFWWCWNPSKKRSILPAGKKAIPIVKGGLPYFGHGLLISKDMVGFIKDCYDKYGSVFQIKLFRIKMVVVCDRVHSSQFFKATEEQLSLYEILARLFFENAFSDKRLPITQIVGVIKKSIAIKFDVFVPKIELEAKRLISELKKQINNKKLNGETNCQIDLAYEAFRFVSSTSVNCFVGIQLPEEIFHSIYKFNKLVNSAIVWTYFFPHWLIRLGLGSQLSKFRTHITEHLQPEIEKYRQDPNKSESPVLRVAVDTMDEITGAPLSNQTIADIVVCLIYISSENTAVGLTNVLVDLAHNRDHWMRCKQEAETYLENGDFKGLLAAALLNACVMETARLNSHLFAINRKPKGSNPFLGDYFLGDADSVTLSGPMFQVHGAAEEVFNDSRTYNPDRFLKSEGREPFNSKSVITWGSGLHTCLGRVFALYEIKIALALFLVNFEFDLDNGQFSKLDYFSQSAFAERKIVKACLNVIN